MPGPGIRLSPFCYKPAIIDAPLSKHNHAIQVRAQNCDARAIQRIQHLRMRVAEPVTVAGTDQRNIGLQLTQQGIAGARFTAMMPQHQQIHGRQRPKQTVFFLEADIAR